MASPKSKRGMTLVELIISMMFISVILSVTTYSVVEVYKVFAVSKSQNKNYLDFVAAQTTVNSDFKNSVAVIVKNATDTDIPADSIAYKLENGVLYVSQNGATVFAYENVNQFAVKFSNAGYRCRMSYYISTGSGSTPLIISGGVVLNNISCAEFLANNPGLSLATDYYLKNDNNGTSDKIIYVQ